ncbi:MAG TPA: GAF domain-containing protein [Myxococcales bacterium]|nr:GAF domain-containing protein [Myxococcales bacterium]
MTPEALQALVEALPVPALIASRGRIVAANRRLAELTGVPVHDLLASSSPFLHFVAPEDREMVLERAAARARGEPVADEVDYMAVAADGRRIPSRAHVAPFPAAGEGGLLMVISRERARAQSAQLIRGFVDVAVAAQGERSEPDYFNVVRESLRGLGLTSTLMEVDGDRLRFAPFAAAMTPVGLELREVLQGWMPLGRVDPELVSADGVLVEDLPALIADLSGLPRARFVGRAAPRAVVTAIRVDGQLRYVLSASGEQIDHAAAGAFGLLGRQIGASLTTLRRIEEVQRRNAELALLLDLGRELVGALDQRHVLEVAARTAARSLRCSCAYVMLAHPEKPVLVVSAREDPEPPPDVEIGSELDLGVSSLSALAFQNQQAYATSDTVKDSRVDPEVMHRFRCRATLAVPLLSQGRPLGVLALFDRSGRSFDAMDERLATHAAQLVAAALVNARLYAEQRARAEEMAQLNEVARALSGALELQPLLGLGGEMMRRILDGDCWFVMLRDDAACGLRFAAVQEENADLIGKLVPYDEPMVSTRAFRERRPIQAVDPSRLQGMARALGERFGNRTTLAVPMLARDEALGAVVILDRKRARSFTQPEMDRALAVAGQLAFAVLSVRLYQDLRTSYAELARTQKELIDRERLAALGELSASIAHEVRNPLGVIFNSVGSLRRILKPQGDAALLLDIVGEEADRLNRMVGDLLDYSRPVQPALEPVPLRPLIEEALYSARHQASGAAGEVRASIEVAEAAATVRADARLLRQALVNLFLNAYQAMPRGGVLQVRTIPADLEGKPAAEIVVRDTGPGIPADIARRIFQPFFTTKATGTGLGLAVVRRIVEGHGGVVAFTPANPGAEFHVRLPLEA